MVSYQDMETYIIVVIFGVLGVIVSMLLKTLYDRGVVIDEFVTGTVTITNIQTLTIILFLTTGVVIAAIKK